MSRRALSQVGNNAVPISNATENKTYTDEEVKVVWTTSEDTGNWTYTITPQNSVTFPEYSINGNPYIYTVTESYNGETIVSQNYSISSGSVSKNGDEAGSDSHSLTMTDSLVNTLKGNISIQKQWNDGYDAYGLRYPEIEVKLQKLTAENAWVDVKKADNITNITSTITKDSKWKGTMENLPVVDADGKTISYRVIETKLSNGEGKEGSIDVPEAGIKDGDTTKPWKSDAVNYSIEHSNTFTLVGGGTIKVTIKNRLSNITTLKVTKKWVGDYQDDAVRYADCRPDSITVKLQVRLASPAGAENPEEGWEDLKDIAGKTVTKVLDNSGNAAEADPNTWVAVFENLPKTDADMKDLQYRAVEMDESVGLTGNAELDATKESGKKLLDSYVAESVDTYTTDGSTNASETIITNTLVPHEDITLYKVWNDSKTGNSTDTATLALYRGDTDAQVATFTLTRDSASNITASETLSHLPKYNANQELITYYAKETHVNGVAVDSATGIVTIPAGAEEEAFSYHVSYSHEYADDPTTAGTMTAETVKPDRATASNEGEISKLYVINTELCDAKGTKVWEDQNDKYETRPSKITIQLQQKLSSAGNDTWITPNLLNEAVNVQILNTPADSNQAEFGFESLLRYRDSVDILVWQGTKRILSQAEFTYRVLESAMTFGSGDAETNMAVAYSTDSSNTSLYSDLDEPVVAGYRISHGYAGGKTTITNALETISISGKKTWTAKEGLEENVSKRPSAVTVEVYELVPNESGTTEVKLNPQPTLSKALSASNDWEYSFTGLPKYQKTQTAVLRNYVVKEVHVPLYQTEQSSTSGERKTDGSDDIINADFTNQQMNLNFKISGSVEWKDTSNQYGTRPKNDALTVYDTTGVEIPNSEYEVSWTGMESDVWSYEIVGLPTRDEHENLLTYIIAEKGAKDYVSEIVEGQTVPDGKDNHYRLVTVNDAEEISGVNFVNQLETITLSGSKHWQGSQGVAEDTTRRPESIELTVYEERQGAGGEKTAVVLNPQPVCSKELTAENGWQYCFTDLPKYKAGDNTTLRTYFVKESGVKFYEQQPIAVEDVSGSSQNYNSYGIADAQNNIINADFTNRQKSLTFKLSGSVTWNDRDNKRDLRPETDTLTLYHADGTQVAPELFSVEWTQTDTNEWQYSILSLPRYDAEENLLTYHVMEAGAADYTAELKENALIPVPEGKDNHYREVTVPAAGDVVNVDFVNHLEDGSLAISNTMRADSAIPSEPFAYTVMLTGKDNVSALYRGSYQVYNINDDWTASPKRTAAVDADGRLFLSVNEKLLITEIQSGFAYEIVQLEYPKYGVDQVTGNKGVIVTDTTTSAEYVNAEVREITIANNTVNPAKPNVSNVGGTVKVVLDESDIPSEPDEDEKYTNKSAVIWMPDMNWKFTDSFTISYRDNDVDAWTTITVNDYLREDGTPKPMTDSAYTELLQVFPNAVVSYDDFEHMVKLRFARLITEMKYQTQVEVQFVPTIAVENKTDNYAGGKVSVVGGVESSKGDGLYNVDGHAPYVAKQIQAMADSDYQIDMEHLTINLQRVKARMAAKDAKTLQLDSDGRFTTTVSDTLAGVEEAIPVSGRVTTVKDALGNVTSLVLELDAVPVPLELGVRFIPVNKPAETTAPTTSPTAEPNVSPSPVVTPEPTSPPIVSESPSENTDDDDSNGDKPSAGPEAEQKDSAGTAEKPAKTVDTAPVGAVGGLGLLCLIGAWLLLRKQKTK